MKEYNLGYMSKEIANKVFDALNGKTYMNFQVALGICPSGMSVDILTDYDATDVEILTFAMGYMAEQIH